MAKKKITLDDLAVMVAKGFHEVSGQFKQIDGQFEQIGGRFEQIDGQFEKLDGRIDALETRLEKKMDDGFHAVNRRIDLLREDISDLPDVREAVEDHDKRLSRVERKVGVVG